MSKQVLIDLSHPFGSGCPLWPYFEDVQIEKKHYMAKSGVLSQKVTTVMHVTTHADSPAHVIEGAKYTHEIPLDKYYGEAVCLDIPKDKWGLITAEDLDKACEKTPVKEGDIVLIHTGWNKYWGDSQKYFLHAPGLGKSAGEWFVKHKVKAVGVDQQALDHPLHTAIGPHGTGPIRPDICKEYFEETGHTVEEDFPEWEPCHNLILSHDILGWENVGGDIAKVVGRRFTLAGFPIRWYMGDGSIVRLVAITTDDNINDVPDRIYPYGVV